MRMEYREICASLAQAVGIEVEELFPQRLYALPRIVGVFETPLRMLPLGKEALALPAPTTPEDEAIYHEKLDAVCGVIDSLPDRQRRVVDGHFLQEKFYWELGAELGVSASYAQQLGEDGLALIRRKLNRAFRH